MKARKKVSRQRERLDLTIYLYCTIRHPRKYNNHYTTTLLLDMTMTVRFGFAFLVGGGKEGRNNAKHLSSWFVLSQKKPHFLFKRSRHEAYLAPGSCQSKRTSKLGICCCYGRRYGIISGTTPSSKRSGELR